MPHVLEHFGIFAATGIAFGLGYVRRYGPMTIALVIFAGVIEVAQFFVPGRTHALAISSSMRWPAASGCCRRRFSS